MSIIENEIMYPDYKNCIANLPNSIMKRFGIPTAGDTLPILDTFLEKKYKNIVVLLLDGMGVNILEKNLQKDGFFRSHYKGCFSSTFPPTTVAATTSVMNGMMPCEHSWLGWNCYYPAIGENVTVFLNTLQDTEIPAADYPVAKRYAEYVSVSDRFHEAGKEAYVSSKHEEPYPETLEDVLKRVQELCRKDSEKYIYAYWDDPDHTMHRNGCFGEVTRDVLQKLEKQVKEFCEELEDTLVIITADHGHIDTRGVVLTDYPKIMECLVRMPGIEPRSLNFFIKEGMEKQFEEEFRKEFQESFMLLTKQEVLEKKLFGDGKEHPLFQSMLGDYLAVAVSDLSIFTNKEKCDRTKGAHAGMLKDEMVIPLIIIEK